MKFFVYHVHTIDPPDERMQGALESRKKTRYALIKYPAIVSTKKIAEGRFFGRVSRGGSDILRPSVSQ
jgi:hypothetical protein